jgi:hypothetical protein
MTAVKPDRNRYAVVVADRVVSRHSNKKAASAALTREVWRWRLGANGRPRAILWVRANRSQDKNRWLTRIYVLQRRGTHAGLARVIDLWPKRGVSDGQDQATS